MPICEHLNVNRNDINRCEFEVEICDNALECACCCYFLEKHKEQVVDEILEGITKIPKEITRIKIPLLPVPENVPYYSYDGIQTIIYNLFRTDKANQIKHLKKEISYLKVYYEKNSLFTLPIIQIEIIFLGRLHEKTIDELWKTLKAEVLFFTGSVGDITVIDIGGHNHLREIFKIPLLVGYPEFKKTGVLLESRFTDEQTKQMNYLHSFTLYQLIMSRIVNNNTLELFEIQKRAIQNENKKESSYNNEISDYDLIRAIFGDEKDMPNFDSEDKMNEINDELPF
jgi:hypothetical protein